MSLSIHQLYKQDENKYKLNLLAGRQGLSHDVAWVQVMEDADYGSFLRPHALIFTTGSALAGRLRRIPAGCGCIRPRRQHREVSLRFGYYSRLEGPLRGSCFSFVHHALGSAAGRHYPVFFIVPVPDESRRVPGHYGLEGIPLWRPGLVGPE